MVRELLRATEVTALPENANKFRNTSWNLALCLGSWTAQWAKIENLIEQEETSEAKKICRSWAQKIKEKFSIDTEIILKLGNRTDELVKLLKEDKDIRFLVLATSDEGESPGPIIKSLMSAKIKELSIPAVLVPGSIEEKDIDLIV